MYKAVEYENAAKLIAFHHLRQPLVPKKCICANISSSAGGRSKLIGQTWHLFILHKSSVTSAPAHASKGTQWGRQGVDSRRNRSPFHPLWAAAWTISLLPPPPHPSSPVRCIRSCSVPITPVEPLQFWLAALHGRHPAAFPSSTYGF